MKSMTGFGEAIGENSSYRAEVTIRSVNHRFLDVVVRVPEEHRAMESPVSEVVRGVLMRGRVDVRISVETLGERDVEIRVREEVLRQLVSQLESVRASGLVSGELELGDVARFPQLISIREAPLDWSEEDQALVLSTVTGALHQVVSARAHEGENLRTVLLGKLGDLGVRVESLERRRGVVAEETATTLENRLKDLLAVETVPSERLAQEAALLVERSDVREELDRLMAHLEHFRSISDGEAPHGRRLEFLVQEIQRELNTLGGKCRDAEMGRDVVEAKLLCEQLREQLLNVE